MSKEKEIKERKRAVESSFKKIKLNAICRVAFFIKNIKEEKSLQLSFNDFNCFTSNFQRLIETASSYEAQRG